MPMESLVMETLRVTMMMRRNQWSAATTLSLLERRSGLGNHPLGPNRARGRSVSSHWCIVMQCALSGSWWGVVNLMCSLSIFEGIEPSSWRNAFTCLHVALQGQIYIHMELIIAKVMVDGLVVSVQQ